MGLVGVVFPPPGRGGLGYLGAGRPGGGWGGIQSGPVGSGIPAHRSLTSRLSRHMSCMGGKIMLLIVECIKPCLLLSNKSKISKMERG